MWTKPFSYKEGFVVGAGLIMAGIALQLSVGPLDWWFFRAPVNYVVLAVLCIVTIFLHIVRHQAYAVRFLTTAQAAVPALIYATLLTAMMGIVRQVPSTSPPTDALGFSRMLSAWPFVLIYVYITLIVGLVSLKQATALLSRQDKVMRHLPSLLCHSGLFIALTNATLGSADMQRLKMICAIGEPEWRAVNERGQIKQLSVTVELKRFILEESEEGMPKRFASEINIYTRSGESYAATVDVNHPAEVKGWKIYQYGYDTAADASSRISILELVSDPWLPYVYAGIALLLCGAVLMFLSGRHKGTNKVNPQL